MKKLAKLSLTLLAAGIISACGSSGGGDNNSSPAATDTTNNTGSTTTTPTTPSTPSTPATPPAATNTNSMGTAVRTSDGKQFDIEKAASYNTLLIVDGKTLPVAISGFRSGGFTNASGSTINGVRYNQFAVSGTKFNNVKFGVVEGYAFAQGNVTAASAIPATGTATYSVDGVLVSNNGRPTTSTDNTLNVDFANKTVNGTVAPSVSVTDAKISGNAFEGAAVYNGSSAPLKGHFYGADASELGGAYGSATFSGSFGGKKQ